MLPRLALTLALAVLVVPGVPAQTQFPEPQPAVDVQEFDAPAYISVVDGSAALERDGRIENAPLNMPLLSGDRLRTADGRIEVRFADGGRLHLDARTSLDVLSDDLVRLVDGRIRLSVQRAKQVSYRVDSAVGSVRITQPGEYRVALIRAAQETQLELAVVRGAGDIFTEQGTTTVRSGERAYASAGLAPSYAYTYNSATMDEFDRWSEMQRGTVYAASSESSQYLPSDMGGYASTFDQYGDWRYQETYGQVWYPRVASGWRPYYYGRWAPYPRYGWTWIAGDPFGYPTHHYGRWGISAGAWFWIPSRVWSPAYVSWGYAPSYVSWCPLGWNNRAVFSIGYYNVGPGYYAGHYGGHYYSAWTTVPRGHFGHHYYAHQYAVNWDRPGYTGARARFTEGRVAPDTGGLTGPRNAAPVRFAGTRAAPAGLNRPAAPDVARARDGTGRALPQRDFAAQRRTDSARSVDVARARDGSRATQGETPRFINRGEQIIRSQTGRPIAPNDTAIARTAPPGTSSGAGARRFDGAPQTPAGQPWLGGAGDHPAYRPAPSVNQDSRAYAPSYDRAIPRTQDVPGSIDRQLPRTMPRNGQGTGGAYSSPYPGDRTYTRPSAGDRTYGQPFLGDRAYQRPSTGEQPFLRSSPGPVDPPRAVERAAPAPPPAQSAGRPMDRSMPAARPMERAAPAPPPAAAPRSGGERAVPRAGGGGASSGSRGGGRSR